MLNNWTTTQTRDKNRITQGYDCDPNTLYDEAYFCCFLSFYLHFIFSFVYLIDYFGPLLSLLMWNVLA